MLASTMQHSTHNHTPTHQPPPHPPDTCPRGALDGPGQEQPEKTPTVSPQDPTVSQTTRNHNGPPENHEPIIMFPPPTPRTFQGMKSRKRRTKTRRPP